MTPRERIYAIFQGRRYDRPAVTPIFMSWAAHFIGRTYRDYYLDGDVLVEAQLAVAKAFNLDQVSAISDPWREASAYGMEFDYPENGVGRPRGVLIQDQQDVARIRPFEIENAERPRQRIESVRKMAGAVGKTHSVLGWAEGPLAVYADLRGVESMFLDLIDTPEMYLGAVEVIIENQIRFAKAQIDAGADMIGVGDSVASLVSPQMYLDYVLPFERRLFDAIHAAGAAVKLHVCGDISRSIHLMAQTGCDVIDIDWMVPVDRSRAMVGPDVTLAGNFDPSAVLLQGTPQQVATAAKQCIEMGGRRFILQPGCEVPPGTPEENLRAFCPCEGCLIPDAMRL
ncbi:MAG: uroporphyrinogen decarboxylase family protein [Sedimentisphaerales bacterium]|nr:uroporphyrinogen decarboxylase family protein [Sedimentisphaerales bacterium]